MGREGASAWTILWHLGHARFGRTWRITREGKRPRRILSTSATSSPSAFISVPLRALASGCVNEGLAHDRLSRQRSAHRSDAFRQNGRERRPPRQPHAPRDPQASIPAGRSSPSICSGIGRTASGEAWGLELKLLDLRELEKMGALFEDDPLADLDVIG